MVAGRVLGPLWGPGACNSPKLTVSWGFLKMVIERRGTLPVSLSNLKGKAEKKEMLEQILQQYEVAKQEPKKTRDMLSEIAGVNVHDVQWKGVAKESTLHVVLRVRGDMHDETIEREDYQPTWNMFGPPDEQTQTLPRQARGILSGPIYPKDRIAITIYQLQCVGACPKSVVQK